MTKPKVTAPVVKEESPKAKRVRKPKTTSEVVKDPQTDMPVSMDLEEDPQVSNIDPKIVELEEQVNTLKNEKETLFAQIEDKTKAYDNLRTTYNKLLEDYKVEKNKNKQISKALEDAKARAGEYKASWNSAKAARDQFASDKAKIEKELANTNEKLADAKFDLDTYLADCKKASILAMIFGVAFVASLIVSFVIAFA